MRLLPVMDVMGGMVVRGLAGRREEYRPVVSRLTTSCDPVEVARAFRDQLGLDELYVADLDAIAGAAPAWSMYAALRALGCRLWVDAGVREAASALRFLEADIERIVAGLETLCGPETLDHLCRDHRERMVFSLDLIAGKPLGNGAAWRSEDAWAIAERAVESWVRTMIVLDLARVGGGTGTGTEALCGRLASHYPKLEVVAGGGIRDRADLVRFKELGIRGVLVASALHDGRLGPADWGGL